MLSLVALDLDTLAESKQPLKESMVKAITDLLFETDVGVISGGDWPQLEKQIVSRLPKRADLYKLWLMPTTGTKLYKYDGHEWAPEFDDIFLYSERDEILTAFHESLNANGFTPEKTWGERLEVRGSQITISALGQQAPVAEKKLWDPDFAKRKIIQADLRKRLPGLSINMGGSTSSSIDITKGVDKGAALKKLIEVNGVVPKETLFIGNDYPAKEIGVKTALVRDPEGTLAVITAIVKCLEGLQW
ncbi:HAD-superhydrolase, subIIB family protein [Astrocystis sublimbata]|nr:HAD-superhydrolase, subIIB family protein [Astrocystis sublimbata]